MQPADYEKLGQFYLGREYDLEKKNSAGKNLVAARGAARTMQQREDVEHAKENFASAQEELDALNAELEEKIARIRVT